MALLLLTAFAAPAQPVITNAPGYVITWDGNNGDNPHVTQRAHEYR